jgi:hypothetical protein
MILIPFIGYRLNISADWASQFCICCDMERMSQESFCHLNFMGIQLVGELKGAKDASTKLITQKF